MQSSVVIIIKGASQQTPTQVHKIENSDTSTGWKNVDSLNKMSSLFLKVPTKYLQIKKAFIAFYCIYCHLAGAIYKRTSRSEFFTVHF